MCETIFGIYSTEDSVLTITGWSDSMVFLEGSVQKVKCTAMTGNPLPKLIWKVGSDEVASQEEIITKEISVSAEMTITMDRSDKCKAKEKKKKGKVLVGKDINHLQGQLAAEDRGH